MVELLKKIPLWLVILAAGIGYFTWSQNRIEDLSAELAQTAFSFDSVVVIDSVTTLRLAQRTIERDSLADAIDLAESVGGELVAAAVIHADPRPTDIVTVEVPVFVSDDSTRIGLVNDTTEHGVLTGTITAPPCCAPLDLTYAFDPAPLDLTVALLRIEGDNAVFGVRYRGGSVDIETPFARLPAEPKRLIPYLGAQYEFSEAGWAVIGGANFRMLFGVRGFVQGSQLLREGSPELRVGFTKEF